MALFPPGVIVAGGPVADWQGTLDPAEDAAIAAAGPRRRAEYTAGRQAARAALARLGRPSAALPPAPDGPPVWPGGVTGSISHGGGWCLAALCDDAATARALGLDIEPDRPLAQDLIAEILGPAERAALPDGSSRQDAALRLFSAKEAAFKAQFTLSRVMLDFDGLRIVLLADGRFSATLLRGAGPLTIGTTWHGRQATTAGLVISALAIR